MLYGSFIHGDSSLTSRGRQSSIGTFIMLEIKGVLPINGIRFRHEPKIGIKSSKYKYTVSNKKAGMLIVEFIVKVSHFVCVFLRDVSVR